MLLLKLEGDLTGVAVAVFETVGNEDEDVAAEGIGGEVARSLTQTKSDGRIAEAGEAVIYLTDGRTAARRAAQNGIENTVRMDEDPGERLPVVDGEVMTRMVAGSDQRNDNLSWPMSKGTQKTIKGITSPREFFTRIRHQVE